MLKERAQAPHSPRTGRFECLKLTTYSGALPKPLMLETGFPRNNFAPTF
jgi:hypothetical protein